MNNICLSCKKLERRGLIVSSIDIVPFVFCSFHQIYMNNLSVASCLQYEKNSYKKTNEELQRDFFR